MIPPLYPTYPCISVHGPHLDRPVPAGGIDQSLPPPLHRLHAVSVARQRKQKRPRSGVPHPHRLVLAAACQSLTGLVRMQRFPRKPRHPALVPTHRPTQLRARLGIPHTHLASPVRTGKSAAIRRPCSAQHVVLVSLADLQRSAGTCIPETNGRIASSTVSRNTGTDA